MTYTAVNPHACDLPSPNNLFSGELHNDTELVTSCRDSKGQAGVNEEMQELELMVETMGGMTSTDFNQQLSTTLGKAVCARKARIEREAGTCVVTPVCTSARDDVKHERDVPLPKPTDLFPVTPPPFKGPSSMAGAGEDDGTALLGVAHMITSGDLTQTVIANTGKVICIGGEHETKTHGNKTIDTPDNDWDPGPTCNLEKTTLGTKAIDAFHRLRPGQGGWDPGQPRAETAQWQARAPQALQTVHEAGQAQDPGALAMVAHAIIARERFLTFTADDHAHYAFIASTMILNADGHLSPKPYR